jgi:glucose/arabinose dehydrogenase
LISDLAFPVRVGVLDADHLLVAELTTGFVFRYNRITQERNNLIGFPGFSGSGDGISGLLIDREYDSNGFVYVYHTANDGRNALSRLVVRDGSLKENQLLQTFSRKGSHNGGGMYQLPDGSLLIGIGDGDSPASAQDANRFEGKVVIVNRNGELLDAGNGLPQGIYALGFRNPFGIDGEGSERIFVADNGPECDDEINVLQSGGNYGWRSGYECGVHLPGHLPPLHVWNPSEGITDLVYLASRRTLVTSLFNINSLRSLELDTRGMRVVQENEILLHDEPVIALYAVNDDEVLFSTPTKIYAYRF